MANQHGKKQKIENLQYILHGPDKQSSFMLQWPVLKGINKAKNSGTSLGRLNDVREFKIQY